MDNTDNITFSKFSQKPTYVVTNENDQITKQHIQNYTDVARENTEEKSGQPHHKFSKNLAYTVSSLSTFLDSYSTKPAFNQSLKQSYEPSQSAQTSYEKEKTSSALTTETTSSQSTFFQEGSKRVTLQTSRACKRTNQNNEAEAPTAKVPKKQKKTTTSTQSAPLKLTTKTPKNNEKIESNGVKKVSLQPQKRQNRINQNERTPPAKKQKLNQQSEQTESLVVKPVSMNIKSEYKVIAKIFFDKSFDELSKERIEIIKKLSHEEVEAVSKLSTEETEAVRTLLDVLKQRKIKINKIFYQLIAMAATASSAETDKGQNVFIKYCHNGTVFFTNLPPNSKKTSILTSVLIFQTHVEDFAKRTQNEIKSLAEMKELSTILSMCCTKGLPNLEAVDKLLNWSCWKKKSDGSFDMELFCAVASMCRTKGLPNLEAVEKLLNLPCWKKKKKPDGSFDMELFCAVASMCRTKGLPNLEAVEKLLNWDRWYKPKLDGSFNRELFRAVASMCRTKGLPSLEAVKELLNWDRWYKPKPDGSFNRELFRAVASMCTEKGLPSLEAVKKLLNLPCWEKLDGSFDMELFRAVASMCNQKGLPNLEAVKELLNWSCWKKGPDDSFNRELFRAVASMCTEKGLPSLEAVEKLLDLPCWKKRSDGSFNIQLFRAVAAMCVKKGFPKKSEVEAVLNWLSNGIEPFKIQLLRTMNRLQAQRSLPNINQLEKCEKDLLVLFPLASTSEDSDEEDPIEEDNSEHLYQIKEVALYLYTGHSNYSVNWKTVRNFCNKSVCDNNDAKLKILCTLLSSFGGAGVSYYLSHQEQQKELLNLAKLSAPLKLVISAMQQNIPSESRKEYIEFGQYLRNPPNFTDWKQLLLESQNLSDVPLLKNKDDQRSYLQALWNLAPGDRKIFFDPERARTILEIIPSPSFLREFGKKYSGGKLKQLLEACSGLKNDTITREGIKALFLALLTGQFCLYNYEEIPDYCLSGYTDDAQGVLISVSGKVKTSEELALYFIALIMLAVDDDSRCKFNDKELTITDVKEMTNRKISHTFPVPILEIHGDSIQISNWSKEVFRNFLECFDIPKHYHFTEKAWKEYNTPQLAACDQKKLTRLERFHEKRTNDTVTPPVTILTRSELYNLLKLKKKIGPKVWPSFDRHKERLSPQILNKLFKIINSMNPEDLEKHIPDSLKNYLLIKEKELQEQQDNIVCPEVNDRQPVRSVHQADKHPQLNPKVSGNSDTQETSLDKLVNDIKSTALGVSLTRQKNTLRNALIDTLKFDPLLLSVSDATFEYLKEMELYKAAISLLKDGPDLERSNSTLENQVQSEDNDGFDLEEFNLTLDQLEASPLFKNIDVSGLDEFNPISGEAELKTPPYQDTGVFDLEEFI